MGNNTDTYKQTAIGLIPSDWEVKRLGDLCLTFKSGFGITSEQITVEGKYPVYGGNGLRGFTDSYTHNGDYLLIGRQGALCGNIIQIKGNNYISEHAIAVQTNGNNYNSFLAYKLEYQNLNRLSESSAQPGLSVEKLVRIKLSVPPFPEQQKIATILSTWDLAIDHCKTIIEKLKERNKGLSQQLLTGKMRAKGFEVTKWHLKSVEEVATFKNGKAHENDIDEEGDCIVVNSKFISTEGRVFKCSNENLCPLYVNDIAMVMSDIPNGKAIAKCFYITENNKYTLNQRICCITANEETDSRFLFYQLNRNSFYLAFDNGVGQTNLKKEEVLECPLLIPEKAEQKAIANILDAATVELNQYHQKLEQLQQQKKGLMQQLLTGKTRVTI